MKYSGLPLEVKEERPQASASFAVQLPVQNGLAGVKQHVTS